MSNGDAVESARERVEKSATIYAWEYFKYHAGQRQAVFRYYLTLIAAITIAYAYSQRPATDGSPPEIGPLIGFVYIVGSLLFWRLDKRSHHLIKLSEDALKRSESKLAKLIGEDGHTIELMRLGDEKTSKFPRSELASFRQIYSCIFLLVAIVGLFLIHQYLGIVGTIVTLLWYAADVRKRYRAGRIQFDHWGGWLGR